MPGAAMSCAGYLHGLAAARQVLGEQHRAAGSKDISQPPENNQIRFN